ncbi:hypothetical protein [Marinifilum sp.]|uniref:hypothetical protein n=1 Tax=Marinifilum sp. TaxID=2033137 RepID=UPI003BAC6191
MKKNIIVKSLLFALLILGANLLSAQLLPTISTSKEEQLLKRFVYFSMLEKDVKLAVGQKCIEFENVSDLPLLFFSEAMFTAKRAIEVHFINVNNENMVLEHNKSEDDIFFVKSRFVVGEYTKSWFVLIDGHSIILRNCSSKKYLALNREGDFYPVDELSKASRFELIHHF